MCVRMRAFIHTHIHTHTYIYIHAQSRSSGPGGQNVNKLNTKVTVKLHVASAMWVRRV
jgi:protein subunit release factor B